MDPEGFIREGYLDASLRNALALGVPPALAYQMVTLNAAEYFRLDHLIGSIAPGKLADLVMIPSKDEYSPKLVMCSGRVIFRDGQTHVEPKKVSFPDFMFESVKVDNYEIPPVPKEGEVRVMEQVSRLVTKESIVDLSDPEVAKDVLMVLALDRLGSGKAFSGLIKGFGLGKGACGTTISWDSGDIMVVGCDRRSMETVITRLKELGGGAVFAIGEEVAVEFPAPVCGVMTLSPMAVAADQIGRFEEALRENGVPWENPILTINTLGAAAIPHFRLTHNGYVRLRDRAVLGVKV
jgi:adenine deaminase